MYVCKVGVCLLPMEGTESPGKKGTEGCSCCMDTGNRILAF